LCGVHEYASAQILTFLDLAEKSLVSESRTAQFPPEFLDGNGLGMIRVGLASAPRAEREGERLAEPLPVTTGDCPAVPRVAEVHGRYWDLTNEHLDQDSSF
jgi:hypothetical protein